MKSLPKISIIIPVYNVEPYIAECLQSVMRQTYTGEIECILVDDCGKDNSIAIAEKLIEEYTIENQKTKIENPISFRILHHNYNRGLSAARNTGTEAATGDYIYYLDSDDYISDDCIAVLAQPLQEYDYDMVIGDAILFNIAPPIHCLKKEAGPIFTREEIIANQCYPYTSLYHMAWNKLVKKDLFLLYDLSFAEGQLFEDILWSYKCCVCIHSMYVQHYVTYYYRVRENSIMTTHMQKLQKCLQSTQEMIDYVLSHPITDINQDLWHNVVAFYISKFSDVCVKSNNLEAYRLARKRFDYNPIKAWAQRKLSMRNVKRQFHFVLSPTLGFYYLRFRQWKNNAIHSN